MHQRSHRRLLVAASALLVMVAGVAVAAWAWWRSPRPELARLVPRDVDAWVEAPELSKIAAPIARTLGFPERGDGLVDGVATALGVPAADVRAATAGSAACALAVRRSALGVEAAVLLSFPDLDVVRRVARNGSWTRDGTFAGDAERWITKAAGPPSSVAAWLAASRTLVIGAAPLVAAIAEVAAGRGASLATTEAYATARAGATGAADVVVLADARMLVSASGAATFADGWLARGTMATGSLHLGEDGARFTLSGRLTGDAVPDRSAFAPVGELGLGARLPRETIAYVAFATRTGLSGAEAERLLLARAGEADPWLGAAVAADLAVVREEHGLTLASAYDALGSEAIIAIVAAPEAKLGLSPAAELLGRDLALVYVQHLAGGDLGGRVVSAMRERVAASELRGAFDVRPAGAGFRADPRDARATIPSIRVEIVGDHLIAGLGSPRLLERAVSAHARGEATLASDAAHARAVASLPAASHLRAWVDAGRILHALGASPQPGGAPLEGDARRTTAFSTTLSVDAGWSYRVDAHDVFAVLPIARHVTDAAAGGPPVALAAAAAPPEPVGIPECDDYLSRLAACVADLPSHQRAAMLGESQRARDAWRAAAHAARSTVVSVCKSAAEVLPAYCG